MILPVIGSDEFRQLICNQTPIIDVRAPIEFQAGRIPHSVSLPILTDEERKEIGTLYKEAGQEAAIARGHELVSGAIKESRIEAWYQQIEKNPDTVITCFRGGLRSQITQTWLSDRGSLRPRLQGGYKAMRTFLMSEMDRLSAREMVVVSGATGSGKTLLVRDAMKFRPTVDLEKYANHRGSAFGGYKNGQPTQIDYENQLSTALICLESLQDPRALVVEDESRMIGACTQPTLFFESLRNSGIVFLDEPLDSRVQTTFDDYILGSSIGHGVSGAGLEVYATYRQSLNKIAKKLGGLRFSEVEKDFTEAETAYRERFDLEPSKVWIEKLLSYYYDPFYFKSLDKRNPRILFRGLRKDALEFLKS